MPDEFVMPSFASLGGVFDGVPAAVAYAEVIVAEWENALVSGIEHATSMYRYHLDPDPEHMSVYIEGDDMIVDLHTQKAFEDEYGGVREAEGGGVYELPTNASVVRTLRGRHNEAASLVNKYLDFGTGHSG